MTELKKQYDRMTEQYLQSMRQTEIDAFKISELEKIISELRQKIGQRRNSQRKPSVNML